MSRTPTVLSRRDDAAQLAAAAESSDAAFLSVATDDLSDQFILTSDTFSASKNSPRLPAAFSSPLDTRGSSYWSDSARSGAGGGGSSQPLYCPEPEPRWPRGSWLAEPLLPPEAPLRPKKLKPLQKFGAKAIGQKSSFVYLVNQIFGTGVIAVPRVFTLSGWVPCLLADVFVCLSAWLATLMTLRCMTLVDGNQNFERRLEYMSIIARYLRRPYYRVTQAFFYLSIFASNVVSIIVVAQSCDNILAKLCGSTPALLISRRPRFALVHDLSLIYGSESSAPDISLAITLGYILTAAACFPLSLQTMDENMKVQYLSFTVLIATLFGLAVTCWLGAAGAPAALAAALLLRRGRASGGAAAGGAAGPGRRLYARPAAFGARQNGELMSTFLASYSCVNVIPSWANEMSWDVDVNRVVAQGMVFSCIVYYVFGFCVVYSLGVIKTDNVLQEVLDRSSGKDPLVNLLVYAFDLITVAPGILVYCITTRYNIMTEWSGESPQSPRVYYQAVFWSSVLPFLIAWLVSDSTHFSAVLSWSSLVFSLSVNFIAPLLIFLVACAVSPLSHKNPVLHMHRNRFQELLLSLAGRISALVAHRELLELPEAAVLLDDHPDEVAAAAERFRGSLSRAALLSADPPQQQRRMQLAAEADNPFIPKNDEFTAAAGLSLPLYSRSPEHSCCIQIGANESVAASQEEDQFARSRRKRLRNKTQPPSTPPAKVSRRFRWDTVAYRRRQVIAQLAKARHEQALPAAKALEQIVPLAMKAKLGKNLLPQLMYGVSPWSSTGRRNFKHSDFGWYANNTFSVTAPGRRNDRRCATQARSVHVSPFNNYADRWNEPLTVKSAFELRRHNTTSVQRRVQSSFYQSSLSQSEGTSLEEVEYVAPPPPNTPTQLRTGGPASGERPAIIINSPLSPTPNFQRDDTHHHTDGPSGGLCAQAPLADVLSLDSSSSCSRRVSMSLSNDASLKPAPCGRDESMAASIQTPSPLSVRFLVRRSFESDSNRSLSQSRTPQTMRRIRTNTRVRLSRSGLSSAPDDSGAALCLSTDLSVDADDSIASPAISDTNLLSNAEDAYAQDEDMFGEIEKIRIRVFPRGFLRRNHVEFTVVILIALMISCVATALDKFLELISTGD